VTYIPIGICPVGIRSLDPIGVQLDALQASIRAGKQDSVSICNADYVSLDSTKQVLNVESIIQRNILSL
jgi:hypothetical protein